MAVPDKYLAGTSTGQPFETGNSLTVAVTAEALDVATGYEGDTVTYTATVKEGENPLPATFVADLEINSTKVVTDQVFDAGHYDQATKLLTLTFTVPADVGAFSVKLKWAEQII